MDSVSPEILPLRSLLIHHHYPLLRSQETVVEEDTASSSFLHLCLAVTTMTTMIARILLQRRILVSGTSENSSFLHLCLQVGIHAHDFVASLQSTRGSCRPIWSHARITPCASRGRSRLNYSKKLLVWAWAAILLSWDRINCHHLESLTDSNFELWIWTANLEAK